MAEGPTTYSGQRVDELLQCPICLDRFNSPKILPCQHTFCVEPCLRGLIDFRSRILRCPECRAEHLIPHGGADGFPNNLIISNFLDLQPQQANGGGEGARGGAEARAAPQGDQAINSNKCAVCEKEGENSKCGHCNKMVCAGCRKSHITQMKFDIGRLVNQIRRGLPKLSESISETEQRGESVKQQVEAVKSEVRDVVARYIKQLNDREKLLNSELDTFLQGETRSLRLKQENVEVELASISSYCDSTEGLLNRSAEDIPDTELIAIKTQCAEYMSEVRNADVSSGLSTKLVKLEADGQRMNSTISSFGSLVVTTPGSSSRGPTSTRSDANLRASRQRWSSPQPLHELYTRDSNTPPPITPPPTNRPGSAGRGNPNSIGIGPHNEHLIPSYLRSTYDRPSPIVNNTAHDNNVSRYMYRMPTSQENNIPSPTARTARISAIFGAYTPEPMPEPQRPTLRPIERTPVVVGGVARGGVRGSNTRRRGQNRSNIQVAPISRNNTNNEQALTPGRTSNTNFSGRSNYPDLESVDVTTAQPAQSPPPSIFEQQVDNRQAVAFSVDFDESPNARGRRRAPPLQRNNTTRGRNRRNRHGGRRNRSENPQPGPSGERTGSEVTQTVPLARSRTFVMDEADAANLNSNNSNSTEESEINRPIIDTNDNTGELSSVNIEMLTSNDISLSDTVTIRRPPIFYKRKGQVLRIIGGARGSEPGKFTWPRGISVSPRNDSIVVADSSNHRVQVFDCNGELVNQFGCFGTDAGQFDCLAGITCNRDGDVIVADRYNHRIQVFNRYGQLQKVFGREGIAQGQLSYPWGLAIDDTNNVYVVDKENHRIQVFNSNGDFLRVFGTFGEEAGHFNHPSYIAYTPDNKVVISDTDNHRLQVFTSDGQYQSTIGSEGSEIGQLQSPKGVAVDHQGFIVVADSGNNRVQVFRSDGRYYTAFGSHGNGNNQFKGIEGVAILSDGKVVVCDKENHRLQFF